MIPLTSFWFFDWLGHLHPMVVHFPIGLMVGALLLEIWPRARRNDWNPTGMIYLGALSAVFAALFGLLLQNSGEYEGALVNNHQFWGLLTTALSLLTAWMYNRKSKLANWIPKTTLAITCIAMTLAGHFGAGITHGTDYLTAGLPWYQTNQTTGNASQLLSEFSNQNRGDSLTIEQKDRLNLQVRAIFAHNCYQCHSTAKRKGGLALDHKEGVFIGGDYGPVIQIGSAADSEMIRRLKLPRQEEEAMPPKGKQLSGDEIALIELWIDQGAHWASGDLKVFREAELALNKPNVPKASPGIDHPIDRFVNAYFEDEGIRWPALIDDRRFIRRAYLDVKGLLPTQEESDQFIQDRNPEKRMVLIQELLQDQENYTLHWLSFWNDLLRNDYSGTGFITGGRKQITDWLYHSLLDNKPYNEMVRELINPQPESEGFIKGIQWRGVVNASQRTELQAAQNISQSLLGLNLKCASCHNSFINNLTLDQAYGFANIFAKEPLEINRCDKPTGRMAKTAFLFPELGQVDADSLKDRLKQLSDIIIKPENGRLYRTVVNRYWDRLFGRGIVAPVDEMDNLPWNQDLLDWLAFSFIESGYDLHKLLTTIMTSRTYQLPPVAYPSPNYLASESFVFKGPALRRLTVEQFADAFSQTVQPFYHSVGYHPQKEDLEAQWIWHREVEVDRTNIPKPGKRYFRKRFSPDPSRKLIAAKILITADDAFHFYLNGAKTAEGNDWKKVEHLDIPLDRIKDQNIIAIVGNNSGTISNPAGLLFTLRLAYSDSSFQFIESDRSWKTNADENDLTGWQELEFDDSNWQNAHRYGSFTKSYWGILLDYTFDPTDTLQSFARASLVKQDPFMKSLGRPTRENVATQRDVEATLLQALTLTNSEFFVEKLTIGAQNWFERLGDDPEHLIEELYRQLLGRNPSRKESRTILKRFRQNPNPEQVEDIIWALVNLPEFQFI